MNSAVADAGPLIHLAEIDRLDLLGIFEQVHVPEAVWAETVGKLRLDADRLLKAGTVQRHPVPADDVARFVDSHELSELHSGELAALCLCRSIAVPLILTDDLAVRAAARRLSLIPVGSLGVVARAFHNGRITLPQAEASISALYSVSTLFVTRAIVDLALEQLRSQI